MKAQFKIYKKGTTLNGPVTILGDDTFNYEFKKAKFIYLGYEVIEQL